MNPGLPHPLGATVMQDGVNFALAAPHATAVDLCLFDRKGLHEQQRLRLHHCTDGIWHCALPGARPGLVYGWRVDGPRAPQQGHRFDPAKLLLDPYAREIVGRYDGGDIFHFDDSRDNAALALKARINAPLERHATRRPAVAPNQRVLYELHVPSVFGDWPRQSG